MKTILTVPSRPIILSTLCALLLSAVCSAGNTGKIAGKVSDKATGEWLVGASVIIKDMKIGASTDENGDYFILNVPPGTYTVTVMMIGYETIQRTGVEVVIDRTTQQTFALQAGVLEGEEVLVVADRPIIEKGLTASEQVVSTRVLEKSGITSIKEVLNRQSGFFTDNTALAWQRGITKSYVRGSSTVQSVYMMDNLSVNSGLVSDNYSGFNTSSIEQISVQTGGYNAEYGEGRSAVVNVVSKEAISGLHGSLSSRVRPAGVYHFGRNMYSHENNDYVGTGIKYWTRLSQDANSQFAGLDPDSLLEAWRQQTTPNDTLSNYANRAEYELEGTLYGGVMEDLSFLLSGRYKRGVGIFPQLIPYNPEFNVQGYVNYRLSADIKVRFGGFIGETETAEYTSSNFNTIESGEESGWLAPMRIDEQYARAKFNLIGAPYRQWPELRQWSQIFGKVTHVLNAQSFYEFTASALKDRMDRSDRNHLLTDSVGLPVVISMVPRYTLQDYYRTWTKNFSRSFQVKGDYTNQITQAHNLKTGFTFRKFSFDYENYSASSGASQSNNMNVFSGNPYEGSVYVQDKIETEGLIVNLGVRADLFDQNRNAPKNRYDPLAFQIATPGHDVGAPAGIPGTPELERTKLQVAVAPRIGISHPLSEYAVLHFVYGHFYQRPSWVKMFGFPFTNYGARTDSTLNAYAKQTTYMDEWQGYYGNPSMGYERTIQYELGVDYNIADMLKLDVTGYYKDASQEANVITGVYAATYTATKALMISNAGYSDVRGIETKIDSRFNSAFNFGFYHEIYWSFSGEVGYSRLYEPGSPNVNVPKGLRQGRGAWSSLQRVKGWAALNVGTGEGPELFGVRPLSNVDMYVNFWWRQGDEFTYHGPGDMSTEPNNMRWFDFYQIDVRLAKSIYVVGARTELSVDIKNVFNFKFLRLLSGDNLIRYMENPNLPDKERLPKTYDFSEPNVWEWYTYEVPPRVVNFQVAVHF